MPGRVFPNKPLYLETLRNKAGKNSALGVKVALDLAGGVGCLFIPQLISYQGCIVHTIHSTPGIFPRIIDPTVDPLTALSNLVVTQQCDVGFAYDCDADRLVIVDPNGKKLSGDATLLICLRYFLENARNRHIAISVDTSLAAEDLVREYNGKVVYSKVGEPNVVRKIIENNCGAGGEGSSGGYIEPSFLLCRDGVYASTMILKVIQSGGSLKELVSQFSEYYQYRGRVDIERTLAPKILEIVAASESEADLTDGVKVRLSDKSWVLIRASNTENVIRVSAEAKSTERAKQLVSEYTKRIAEIAKEALQRMKGLEYLSPLTKEDSVDEESIIKILWEKIGRDKRRDPFDDDAAWMPNSSRSLFVVTKADMLVATTDAPPQMSARQTCPQIRCILCK